MFEVKVTVEIPGLPEAINALANAMSKTTAPAQAAPAAAPVAFMNTAPAQQITVPESGVIAAPMPTVPESGVIAAPTPTVPAAAPAPVAPPAPVVPTQAAPAPAQVAPSATAPSEAKPLTMDDLGRAGATLIDAGKMPQLIALLGKYGVQAVTQLQPAQFAPFADELRALGAKF